METLFPPDIRKVWVTAPAGAVDPDRLAIGIRNLELCGLEVKLAPHLFHFDSVFPYLSADDERRLADFNTALQDADTDMIIAARGGYGSMRILEKIEWEKFNSRPYLGYSDNTAVLLAMSAKGVGRPIAGVHASRFDDVNAYPLIYSSLKWALNPVDKFTFPTVSSAQIIRQGMVDGPVFPVNLTTLCALLGTSWVPDLSGAVLLIEDIGEPVRKVDRCLTQLHLCGILEKLGGLLIGQFTGIDDSERLSALFERTASEISGPVISGIPFGHELPSLCVPMGVTCMISTTGKHPGITLVDDVKG